MIKKIKRILAVCLATVIVAGTVGPVSKVKAVGVDNNIDFTVKVSQSEVKAGDTITAELWLQGGKNGVSSIAALFEFDADTFTYVSKETGTLINGNDTIQADVDDSKADEGYLTMLVVCDEDTPCYEGGLLYTITLKVKSNPSGDGTIGLGMKDAELVVKNADGTTSIVGKEEITSDTSIVDKTTGEPLPDDAVLVKPSESMLGDVNGDGKVNMRDAVLLRQYVAGWDVEMITDTADANGDGKVNIRDAVLLRQYVAGWDVVLGNSK